MKAKMYSQQSNSLLHDHIIDGFHSTHEGLSKLKDEKLISKEEYTALLEANIKRLVQRIHEFRIREGLADAAKRFTCVFFIALFSWMQVNGDDVEARRPSRARSSRVRRRNE